MADDGPRVVDFGIARAVESTRLTVTGTAFGTPGYLSPEQALGTDVTGATDVFALGAVLVAAAGGSAWGEGTSMALMYRSVHESPDLSAVPAGLRDVVAACLEKNPAARPTPTALLDLLTQTPPSEAPAPYTPTVAVPLRPTVPPRPEVPPAVSHTAATVAPGQDPILVIGDRDTSLAADSTGVTLQVDDAEVDFDWSEIAALDYAPSRRNRLVVTVRLHDGTSYPCELDARRAGRLSEWTEQLDRVVKWRFAR
ncbi:protein kinase domain-containing protein [Streptomyces sp. NPDC003832]